MKVVFELDGYDLGAVGVADIPSQTSRNARCTNVLLELIKTFAWSKVRLLRFCLRAYHG